MSAADRPTLGSPELARVALDLMASSDIDRYVRVAMRASTLLRERMKRDPEFWKDLIARADSLWLKVRASPRGLLEVELAVILAALSQTALPAAEALLRRLAEATGTCFAHFAQRLAELRATTVDLQLHIRTPSRGITAHSEWEAVPAGNRWIIQPAQARPLGIPAPFVLDRTQQQSFRASTQPTA